MKPDATDPDLISAHALPWQQPVIDQLLAFQQAGKLPHALLIETRSATDSASFGWQLASALLCRAEQGTKPCGECAACQSLQQNNFPDFSYTTLLENERTHKPNKDIKIDQIRRLIHQISLTNSHEAGKVALIYPAEKMNTSSANALLKTLEEPTQGAVLTLLTHNAGRLPVTIRSRCQQWVIEKPQREIAVQWLVSKGLTESESHQFLDYSGNDAELAWQLHQQDYAQQFERFKELLQKYLSDKIDVVSMTSGLKKYDSEVLSLILQSIMENQIKSWLPKLNGQSKDVQFRKQKLQALLDLYTRQQRQLAVQDNNLNLQLQLEDVLISLKQLTT